MAQSEKAATDPVESRPPDERLTIGYLTPSILGNVGQSRWHGVMDAAHEQDVSLICYPGWYWRDSQPRRLANVLYDLVSAKNLDGLILGNILQEDLVDRDEFTDFYQRHFQMPVVSIRKTWLGIPFVPLDNYQGMREAIVHLVEVEAFRDGLPRFVRVVGPRGVGFIRGKKQHGVAAAADEGRPVRLQSPQASSPLIQERRCRPQIEQPVAGTPTGGR